MLKFEYEQPLLISGVIINEQALCHLSYIQTGTCFIKNADYRRFNNEGVNDFINDCNIIIHNLFELLLQTDTNKKAEIVDVLERAYSLLSTFKRFELPEELLTPEE